MNTLFTGPHEHFAIDRRLLRELGLNPAALPHATESSLGQTRVGKARVTLSCTACPAKFWRFEIARRNGVEVFESDSGSLHTHWPEVLRRCRAGATHPFVPKRTLVPASGAHVSTI